MSNTPRSRRDLLRGAAAGAVVPAFAARALATGTNDAASVPVPAVGRRRIPSTGELLPMIGLGTSRTFAADPDGDLTGLRAVLAAFFDAGGSLVDSSPMYGTAETVTGRLLDALVRRDYFSATKVWTDEGRDAGIVQMESSMDKMRAPTVDLMQIHNLVDWKTHLATLRDWKQAGRIRYIGITEMRDFELVEKIMRDEDIDFIQIPYSLGDRRVEARVLPAAQETGTAVLVMRPFERGRLFQRFGTRPLPDWAATIGCASWAQIFLKFVLAHPAVTCPIPATSKLHHLHDNMAAGRGPFPDAALLKTMIAFEAAP